MGSVEEIADSFLFKSDEESPKSYSNYYINDFE